MTPRKHPATAHSYQAGRPGPAGVEILNPDRQPVALVHAAPDAARLAQAFAEAPSMLYALQRTWRYLNEHTALTPEGRTLKRLVSDVYERASGHAIEA